MKKGRLEAFSDGVIAIIITIMVLELKVPHMADVASLKPLIPVFISYILSFIYVGIYWNNHHHMLQAAHSVNGTVMWANLHLLFWLSLVPFVTAWMGENHFSMWPTALYGFILLMNGIAYSILAATLLKHHGKDSPFGRIVRTGGKNKLSVILYILSVFLAFKYPFASLALYAVVAAIWLVPDRRIELGLKGEGE